jgi:hypothetical protein
VTLAAALAGMLGAALAGSAPAPAAGPAGLCGDLSPTQAACIGLQKLADGAANECRVLGLPETDCDLPLSQPVRKAAVADYRKSWVHRAIAFQYRLGNRLPLTAAQWLGTHNSFNTPQAGATPSHMDSNQQLTIPQQLDIDVRAIELDPHWVPRANADGGAVIVCHGRGADEQNLGCTTEPPLTTVLEQIDGWLNAHPSQVVALYLDNNFGPDVAYTRTVEALDSTLRRANGGSLLYRPDPGALGNSRGCEDLPLDISRNDIRKAGAQVIVVGNCAGGWAPDVFAWDQNHLESGDTSKYRPYPDCDATYPNRDYATELIRYYEDSTFVSAGIDPEETPAEFEANRLTPAHVASMTACGVNLFGFDQILPNDGRLEASVWSWAPNQPKPSAGDCTVQRPAHGRWRSRPCDLKRQAACRSSAGRWELTPKPVAHRQAFAACSKLGATFDTPRSGDDNSLLHAAGDGHGILLRRRMR